MILAVAEIHVHAKFIKLSMVVPELSW